MPTNLTETESRDWQCHAKLIAAAWQKGVESIIETGRRLGGFTASAEMILQFLERDLLAPVTTKLDS
jgi:hypothetical protein